ncbi:unnamed protein product [Heligmosomoides polygyrus]|uniref:Ground-like domain-containing protein n=1 Tax=Heligmosomoides polygyrus TaxID=6339 RepID=A0A183F3I6_HELPZ|nr:unnamed protein product [Heligmosomoides polygyrus]
MLSANLSGHLTPKCTEIEQQLKKRRKCVENSIQRMNIKGLVFTVNFDGNGFECGIQQAKVECRRAHRDRKENTPQLLTIGGSGRSGHHESHRMRHSASPARDRPHSDHVSSNGDDEPKKHRRKRRDPTRTLENLKEKLATEKDTCVVKENGSTRQMSDSTASTGSDESGSMTKIKNGPRPPLLLITEPTSPQKTCSQLWEESTDGDWTEAEDEADYESDFEYSVSQTFNLRDAMPLGDLYPLSRSSSRCSPFVSDYDSDGSMPLFKLPSRFVP